MEDRGRKEGRQDKVGRIREDDRGEDRKEVGSLSRRGKKDKKSL